MDRNDMNLERIYYAITIGLVAFMLTAELLLTQSGGI